MSPSAPVTAPPAARGYCDVKLTPSEIRQLREENAIMREEISALRGQNARLRAVASPPSSPNELPIDVISKVALCLGNNVDLEGNLPSRHGCRFDVLSFSRCLSYV